MMGDMSRLPENLDTLYCATLLVSWDKANPFQYSRHDLREHLSRYGIVLATKMSPTKAKAIMHMCEVSDPAPVLQRERGNPLNPIRVRVVYCKPSFSV